MSVLARDVAQEFGFRFGRMPKVSRALAQTLIWRR